MIVLFAPLQFCGAIVLIFFLELAVAVLAFLFQDWVRDRFREFFESNIRSYRDDIDLQNLIDSLQKAVSTVAGGRPFLCSVCAAWLRQAWGSGLSRQAGELTALPLLRSAQLLVLGYLVVPWPSWPPSHPLWAPGQQLCSLAAAQSCGAESRFRAGCVTHTARGYCSPASLGPFPLPV